MECVDDMKDQVEIDEVFFGSFDPNIRECKKRTNSETAVADVNGS